ncbi:PREDICTED: transmembrane protein 17B-like [Dufourea novaeangliae]|uniref:transmembrane protein 17B-like n=1 Tax=Dufourea novaeangliae TaxID=178035 RepID=UPI000767D870|nr:PREDICTED: transmembrane protein 17B-like [Dufourea novaeangliae]
MKQLTKNKIKANLPFQVVLYINVWLFPVWLLISITNLDLKYNNVSNVHNTIMLIIFLILLVSDSLKLYLGYVGNLGGKISELAACWLIATLIQLPLEMFLIFHYGTLFQCNKVFVDCFLICLLFLEVITGAIALKNLADLHARTFYLMQLYNMHKSY